MIIIARLSLVGNFIEIFVAVEVIRVYMGSREENINTYS